MTLLSTIYSLHGVSATYTASGGSGVSVTVLIKETPDSVERVGVGIHRHEAEIQVRQSEVATRPNYLDTFLIGSQAWTVVPKGVEELRDFGAFDGEWICFVTRDERPIL